MVLHISNIASSLKKHSFINSGGVLAR